MKRKSKIKRQMFTMGELMLIVGIVVIFLAIGIGLAVVKNGVGGPLGKARERARRLNCQGNLKQFGQAFANYTSAGENLRPTYHGGTEYGTKALELLITSGELTDLNVYICPSSNLIPVAGTSSLEGLVSYAYIPGLDFAAGADSGIMADGHTDPRKPNHKMYGNILFGDGHVAGSTGTSSKNWIKSANWMTTTVSTWGGGTRIIVDESWLETRTDKSFQIGPRIK